MQKGKRWMDLVDFIIVMMESRVELNEMVQEEWCMNE